MVQKFGATLMVGIMTIILMIITLAFMTDVFTSVHEARTADTTVAANVTTGAGDVDADVTLIRDLYNNELGYVTSITSNVTGDTPVASSYVAATRTLTIRGLTANAGHDLTVVHEYDQTSEFTGTGQTLGIYPTLILLGLLALGGRLIWGIWA